MTIDIDFDVFKALTLLRSSESVTYNEVLRQLLKLDEKPIESKPMVSKAVENKPIVPCKDWVVGGVTFPEGTAFRAKANGRMCEGMVAGGALIVGGVTYDSPSGAATAVTGSNWNGWQFWECQFPGKYRWVHLRTLRKP